MLLKQTSKNRSQQCPLLTENSRANVLNNPRTGVSLTGTQVPGKQRSQTVLFYAIFVFLSLDVVNESIFLVNSMPEQTKQQQ